MAAILDEIDLKKKVNQLDAHPVITLSSTFAPQAGEKRGGRQVKGDQQEITLTGGE